MLWLKAFHVIFMVTWFAGLFYLPRLFVYHAMSKDLISIERFKTMERKLFIIMSIGAILTIIFGASMIVLAPATYLPMKWLHLKLALVFLLILFHLYLGRLVHLFKNDRNLYSDRLYRIMNEAPSVFLILIVILAVVKPF